MVLLRIAAASSGGKIELISGKGTGRIDLDTGFATVGPSGEIRLSTGRAIGGKGGDIEVLVGRKVHPINRWHNTVEKWRSKW